MLLRREIEHFFSIYKQLEDKPVDVYGWQPAKDSAWEHRAGSGSLPQRGVS